MSTIKWSTGTVSVGGVELHLQRGGSGSPILVLHREIGTLDSLPFYDALAQHHDVLIPHHPGFGHSPRPDWVGGVRDIAVIHRALLAALDVPSAALLGLGFGGWIAAEMATFAPASQAPLILVGPMGVKPPSGEIMDQALLSYIEYVRAGFHDPAGFDRVFGARPSSEQLVQWDICREMSFRVAWKPYMYSDTLPYLLPLVQANALVLRGDDDRIVPASSAALYAARLPHARQESVAGAGHLVELEQPDALARLITSFLTA
jgi:pimeloyl-ACP methyl ester carboxylesterase